MFIWNENDLNDEQAEAVLDDENILLVACPGSGKTRTLTYKIALELSKLSDSRKFIIAITYTNRAADEIKERVELLGIDPKQLWIGTIHSFCLEWILRPYSLYIPQLKHGFRVTNQYESERLITQLCQEHNTANNLSGGNRIGFYDCGFVATPKPGYKVTTLKASKKPHVIKILKKYQGVLKANNQIDFEQILFFSLQILIENPVVSSILSKIFPYILIDEYQDTKEIQYHIFCSILRENKKCIRLFVVGDPNQSIFQNFGGYPIERKELEKLSGLKIKHVELVKNYRSSEKIIEYFGNFKTFDNEIEAHGSTAAHESSITFNTIVVVGDLIDELVMLIEKNINEYGIVQNEICVLAPWWMHVASMARMLMVKLPDYSFDGPGMTPFAQDIENFWFKLARIVLTEPSPNLYMKRTRWSSEVIKDLENVGADISNISKKKLLKICNSIQINETDGLEYLNQFFKELFKKISINVRCFPSLVEHYDSFFKSATSRIERLSNDGFHHVGEIEMFKKVFQQRSGITVSTCHGIKGAEFDTVIAFCLQEGVVPHFADALNGQDNAKKLLYVITSRARKNIHLISERKRYDGRGIEYQPTQHLLSSGYIYDEPN